MLADGARFVICYDHRDTGRSATYPPGRPGYTVADLVADAGGILDAGGVPSAHVVAVSAGGAFAQRLALDHFCTLRSSRPRRSTAWPVQLLSAWGATRRCLS